MAYSQPFPLNAPGANQQKAQTFGPDLNVRLICPECRDPNPKIVEEFSSGDLVCGGCGLVLGDRIVDTRSEWRVSELLCILHMTKGSVSVRHSRTMKVMTHRVSVPQWIPLWMAWSNWILSSAFATVARV